MFAGSWSRERPALHPEDETERLDMRGQVREREGDGLTLVEIVKLEGLEVAHQDEARALALRQRVEILPRLFVGFAEIAPGALLLDDQHARPEQVDEARTVVELRDMGLVSRDAPPPHPEHVEEGVVKALRLALLVGGILPVPGEGGGAGADLVPRQAHGLHTVLVEIVLVDPLDLVMVARARADVVMDHKPRQFFAVDQDDPFGLRAT